MLLTAGCSVPQSIALEACCATCDEAAQKGHLACLRAARARGCSWSASTAETAAALKDCQLLMWALANGCRWKQPCFHWVAVRGWLLILDWMARHWNVVPGCPGVTRYEFGALAAAVAAYCGHLHVLQALADNPQVSCWPLQDRSPILPALASKGGQLDVLRWLAAFDARFDERVCQLAPSVPILDWALQQGVPAGGVYQHNPIVCAQRDATLNGRRELCICVAKANYMVQKTAGATHEHCSLAALPVQVVRSITSSVWYDVSLQPGSHSPHMSRKDRVVDAVAGV